MTEPRRPVDQALDLLVYAPLGLALSARDLIPKLAERGREQWTNQVGVARLIGQFAVRQGTVEAEKALARARDQALAKLSELGLTGGGGADPAEPPANGATAADGLGTDGPASPRRPEPVPAPGRSTPRTPSSATAPQARPAPASSTLAIPDYDSLSASQVVPRLSGLAPAELEVVRAYEAAHRGRKTILSKITQLEGQ